MKTQELWCDAGDHKWTSPVKRGFAPSNCPEHKSIAKKSSGGNLKGLEKARAARQKIKNEEEKVWSDKIDKVINDPRMAINAGKLSKDARPSTVSKLLYIQEQLSIYRDQRSQSDISNLEKMREKILADPFNRTGHLL